MADYTLSPGGVTSQLNFDLGPAIAASLEHGGRQARTRPPARWRLTSLHDGPGIRPGTLDEPGRVADYWAQHIAPDREVSTDVESLFVVFLSTRANALGHARVAEGTLNTILIHPREVFRLAIVANAASIVLCHNHPSGDPTPSECDIKATRELIRAGQLLKIDLLDHLIIGRADASRPRAWCSLRELGYFYS